MRNLEGEANACIWIRIYLPVGLFDLQLLPTTTKVRGFITNINNKQLESRQPVSVNYNDNKPSFRRCVHLLTFFLLTNSRNNYNWKLILFSQFMTKQVYILSTQTNKKKRATVTFPHWLLLSPLPLFLITIFKKQPTLVTNVNSRLD